MGEQPERPAAGGTGGGFVPEPPGSPAYDAPTQPSRELEDELHAEGDELVEELARQPVADASGRPRGDGSGSEGARAEPESGSKPDSEEDEEEFSFINALGGWKGMLDMGLPGIAFVVAYTALGQQLNWSLIVALGLAGVLAVVRLVRRDPLQNIIGGLVGVGIAAFIANQTGKAEDFFLPSLLINLAYGAGYLIANVIRWPVIGLIVGLAAGWGTSWRQDPHLVRAFQRVSWYWVGMFVLRLVIQLPLYLGGQVEALGITKVALGWPLWAVVVWLTYITLKSWVPKEKWREVKGATAQLGSRGGGRG